MTATILRIGPTEPQAKQREALNAVVNAMQLVEKCGRDPGFIGGDNFNRLAFALVAAHELLKALNEPSRNSEDAL